ncbi:MAG: hypothetical protein LBQ75_02030 [Zoogloeaceae bacterium]|nr:hypothetical protein [Zoogloeaceae bacterium]
MSALFLAALAMLWRFARCGGFAPHDLAWLVERGRATHSCELRRGFYSAAINVLPPLSALNSSDLLLAAPSYYKASGSGLSSCTLF